jgi:hypothetical protein
MPNQIITHQKLDKAVDEAYLKNIPLLRGQSLQNFGGFKDDMERVEWL